MTGHAITVQPKFAVRRELANRDLIAIPILQNNLMKAELHIITHQGRRLDAAASRLLDSLIKTMPSFCS
jgi:DNA-binding transcriptional LysR family regulator